MSTSASIGYNKGGKDHFTFVRMDGWPEEILPAILTAVREKGFKWYVEQLNLARENGGIEELGYDGESLVVEYLYDDEYNEFYSISMAESDFAYSISSNGNFKAWAYGKRIKPGDVIKIIFEGLPDEDY